jgi:hypothetical protein
MHSHHSSHSCSLPVNCRQEQAPSWTPLWPWQKESVGHMLQPGAKPAFELISCPYLAPDVHCVARSITVPCLLATQCNLEWWHHGAASGTTSCWWRYPDSTACAASHKSDASVTLTSRKEPTWVNRASLASQATSKVHAQQSHAVCPPIPANRQQQQGYTGPADRSAVSAESGPVF